MEPRNALKAKRGTKNGALAWCIDNKINIRNCQLVFKKNYMYFGIKLEQQLSK